MGIWGEICEVGHWIIMNDLQLLDDRLHYREKLICGVLSFSKLYRNAMLMIWISLAHAFLSVIDPSKYNATNIARRMSDVNLILIFIIDKDLF